MDLIVLCQTFDHVSSTYTQNIKFLTVRPFVKQENHCRQGHHKCGQFQKSLAAAAELHYVHTYTTKLRPLVKLCRKMSHKEKKQQPLPPGKQACSDAFIRLFCGWQNPTSIIGIWVISVNQGGSLLLCFALSSSQFPCWLVGHKESFLCVKRQTRSFVKTDCHRVAIFSNKAFWWLHLWSF